MLRMRHLASFSNFPELSTESDTASYLIVYTQQLVTISSLKDDILSHGVPGVVSGQSWSPEAGVGGSVSQSSSIFPPMFVRSLLSTLIYTGPALEHHTSHTERNNSDSGTF